MKNTHHHFLFTLAVAVTLVVASMYIFMRISITNMTEAAINSKKELAVLRPDGQTRERPKQSAGDHVEDWNKIFGSFVPVDNAVPFIEMIESFGPVTNSVVVISAIDNVASEEGSLAINGRVSAKVTVKGSWSAVMKAMALVENMPYEVTIDNVKVELFGDVGNAKTASTPWVASFDISATRSI